MNKPNEPSDIKDLVDRGMREVHKKLREEKIRNGEPLVVEIDGKVVHLEPNTMEEINTEER